MHVDCWIIYRKEKVKINLDHKLDKRYICNLITTRMNIMPKVNRHDRTPPSTLIQNIESKSVRLINLPITSSYSIPPPVPATLHHLVSQFVSTKSHTRRLRKTKNKKQKHHNSQINSRKSSQKSVTNIVYKYTTAAVVSTHSPLTKSQRDPKQWKEKSPTSLWYGP